MLRSQKANHIMIVTNQDFSLLFFCSATVAVAATTPFTCLRLYPYPQANSIPAYLINVDANTSTVGSQYRSVDGLRSRCLPSSDMWIEDSKGSLLCSGNSPNVSKCGWQTSGNIEKRIVFCSFPSFFVLATEVHLLIQKGSRVTQQSIYPASPACSPVR